jgi:CRP-like cAMP-binding protein
MEEKGITSIANVVAKPPSDRDSLEKQFFVMYLKLRVPFFIDFDKKTLKFIMERISCQFFKKGKIVQEFGQEGDQMLVVIDGELSCYFKKSSENIGDNEPEVVIGPNDTWGENTMTNEINFEYTVRASKKTLVMRLDKKDLIEVLQHVKVI